MKNKSYNLISDESKKKAMDQFLKAEDDAILKLKKSDKFYNQKQK